MYLNVTVKPIQVIQKHLIVHPTAHLMDLSLCVRLMPCSLSNLFTNIDIFV